MAERASRDIVEFHDSVPEVHSLPPQAGSMTHTVACSIEQCRYCKKIREYWKGMQSKEVIQHMQQHFIEATQEEWRKWIASLEPKKKSQMKKHH